MKHAILALTLITANAHAELKLAEKKLPIYLSETKEQLNPVQAVQASIKGQRVFKCELVEAQASETGNVSLKKVK